MDRQDPYLQQAAAMPAMPEVARKLLNSFDRDDLAIGELTRLIGQDQTLSAKVLRLANSARYAPTRTIAALPDAAACLGLRTLRDLTLSASMTGAFPALPGFDRLAFWRDNLANAAYAQGLAHALSVDADVAYLGGLMLRTGQVLMAMVSPGPMAEVARHTVELDSRIGFEQSIIGRAHPAVTAALARHWKFPESLALAFDAAADPLAARPFCRMGAVLRLACVVTESRDRGLSASEGLQTAQPALVEHLQLDLAWVETHLPSHALATAGADMMMG
ncbi:HDOD domain-containing protein [Aquabacterium sp. OR-4]|uniref:HDOD domain-containing protein n=1 Tax=Aquabacterium sp. OR-4 TaxID=2978127 RepID=UPI0028C7295A|nr:HDOD domain-containing protein [Aquabacterium sp. OR-4]MDT7836501.1 HDOD domain-containing protein [Aquabacterium sp. OR-4]